MNLSAHEFLQPRRLQDTEASVLGEALVATINAHLARHSAMSWAEVQAVVRVISAAVAAEVIGDAAESGRPD